MALPQTRISVSVGDWMPRITLATASGNLFDSWDEANSGLARAYWISAPPPAPAAALLAGTLAGCETLLHMVAAQPPTDADGLSSWLVDREGELGRAVGATGPLAVIVDAAGRVAALLPAPSPDGVAALAMRLYMASTPVVVQAKAPVLLLDRVVDPALCRELIEHWQRSDKIANTVGCQAGNVVNADAKRRQDAQVDDPALFIRLRDCLVRRVAPAILQAFHTRVTVIEAPLVGCYDAACGGVFHRHRDNTSSQTAHRQFALSVNLNADHEYDGGELRFPEFGRQLYRPVAGETLVFSSSLLHEVMPVTRGRRFGVFTFLSASCPSVGRPLPPRAR